MTEYLYQIKIAAWVVRPIMFQVWTTTQYQSTEFPSSSQMALKTTETFIDAKTDLKYRRWCLASEMEMPLALEMQLGKLMKPMNDCLLNNLYSLSMYY